MGDELDGIRRGADPVAGPEALTPEQVEEFLEEINSFARTLGTHEGRVSAHPSTAAVIVAGGSGERFGNLGGKQLFELLGKPMLTWSIEAFDAVADVGLIVVVCPQDRCTEYREAAVDPFEFATPIEFAPAGEIRQESAMNGVDAVPTDYDVIAVHDGARPLVTADIVTHAISMLKGNLDADGIVVGHPSIDTLKVVNEHAIAGTPDRSMFWVAQTPQVFRSDICRRAYSTAMFEGFVGTDDSSLVERMGGHVMMLDGPRDNIKLTVPEDIGPVVAALAKRVAGDDA